ncbi:hypothetical protein B0J14DRAFT_373717 [Halenospora varia]|nr:hypothetical protein B0J14DRAFT_373717 [Halenospora varia]
MRSSVTHRFLALNLVTASPIPNSPGLALAHYLQGDTSVPSSPIVPLTPLSPLSPNPAAYPNVHLSLYSPGKFKRQPPPTVLGAPSAPCLAPAAPPPDTPVPLSTPPAAPTVPAAPGVPTPSVLAAPGVPYQPSTPSIPGVPSQPIIPTQLCHVSTSCQHTSQYYD